MSRKSFRPSMLRAILFVALAALSRGCVPQAALGQNPRIHPAGVPHANQPRSMVQPIFLHHPGYRVRPILPIFYAPRRPFWGAPLYGFGLGLGFSPLWWRSCGPFWGWTWGYNCYALPVYIGEEYRQLPQLYMNDGTVYNVTDYWKVDDTLHFTTLDESGVSWSEHTIDFSQLDLQKTKDVAQQRGFHFMLRDEPMQKYLQDHPEIGAPSTSAPAGSAPN